MSKSEGLKRLSNFVNYSSIGFALLILLIAAYPILFNGREVDEIQIVLVITASIIYSLGKGISWIIEGFSI